MLNFNLTKDDIGYLRLIIDIQSMDEDKKAAKASIYSDKNIKTKYSIYEPDMNSYTENSHN